MKVGDNMKDQFEKKLQEDFTSTSPNVLDKIKQSHRFEVPEAPKKQSIFEIFRLRKVRYTFASLFVVALLAVVLLNQPTEQIYASTVTIDLNPQFEIRVDDEDKIIDITALNNDGEEIIQDLGEYERQELHEVLVKLVQALNRKGYLEQNENAIMVYVKGVDEQVKARIQQYVEETLQEEANKYQKQFQFVKSNIDYTPVEMIGIRRFAQDNDVNVGRVILVLEILDADTEETYTAQELSTMSMSDLYDIYLSFFSEDDQSSDQGNGSNGNN